MNFEQHIIGALMQDAAKLDDVMDLVRPDQFESRDCRLIYTAIIQISAAGGTPDLVTVMERVKGMNITPLFLTQCTDQVIPSNVVDYARQQHNLYRKRLFKGLAERVSVLADDSGEDADSLGRELQAGLNDIEDNTAAKRWDDSAAAVTERYMRWIDDAKNGKVRLWPCHTVGLCNPEQPVNSVIPYWYGGLSVIISAYTTSGKSAYAVNLALAEAEAGVKVAVFSNEMGERSYADRAAGYFSDIPYGHIRYNKMHDIDTERIDQALLRFSQLPIRIVENCYSSGDLIRQVKRMQYHFKPDIVILDYLQKLKPLAGEKDYQSMTRQGRELCEAARRYDFALVMVSQIDNSSQKDGADNSFMPTKGSGDTSADADIFIQLSRKTMDEAKKHEIDFYVKKNREFGRTGFNERLRFNLSFTKIIEADRPAPSLPPRRRYPPSAADGD